MDAPAPSLVRAANVTDVDLPKMKGLELCETLAASSYSLPFILFTARTDELTRNLALAANPIALLIRPFGKIAPGFDRRCTAQRELAVDC